jgi:hypothetical protein
MSSASARRKLIQAREEKELNTQQQYIEHKRRILLYDHLAEVVKSPLENSDSDDASDSGLNREESVTTPSECSVVTPHDTPPAPLAFEKPESGTTVQVSTLPEKPQLHLMLPEPLAGTQPFTSQPSPALKLQASLVALADFTYDRFSMIFDSPQPVTSPTEPMSTPEVDFDDYSPSPVEIATPISICLPKTRPAVISISSRSSKKRRAISAQSPLTQEARPRSPVADPRPPPPPPRSAKRLSSSSVHSAFLASEASPIQVPDLPANASSIIASANRDSMAWPASTDNKKSMQRKSSQPLMSAIKTGHARVSSIRSMMRSPTHNHSTSISSSRPESRSSRPPTSAADIMNDDFKPFETVPANLYDAPQVRPHTSHQRMSRPSISSTASRQPSVTALPLYPHLSNRSTSNLMELEPHADSIHRKKSFSGLRKRSESIGQAIKSASSRTKSSAGHTPKLSQEYDTPPPHPLPQAALRVPTARPSQAAELSSFPTSPLPSPRGSISAKSYRSRKSVASYSMFPPGPKIGSDMKNGVGLGLGLRA